MSSKKSVPEAKEGLSKFKQEVASELGVPLGKYNGDISSKQNGSVGGEMVKRMGLEYESKLKKIYIKGADYNVSTFLI